ncbi:MAG TPA: FHA domain-containing protein [Lysobacter sp.]|nr:FHA domain-containing protein [Lysobacter sp.]
MPARLTAYLPDDAASTRIVEDAASLQIGRETDSTLRLAHPSVSRRHAELIGDGGAWRLRDLGSKNGTFADGVRVQDALLARSCWLRFGDVYCEFELLSSAQAEAMESEAGQRRALSRAMTQRLASHSHADDVLDDIIRGVLELAGCTRGFLLIARESGFRVHSAVGLDPRTLLARQFSGSVGAVQRAIDERRPVIVNEIAHAPWLAQRASVVASGLQSLVCLPLLDGERVLGAVYADRRDPGPPLTELDRDLLAAFAESATLWLLADRGLDTLDSAPQWSAIVAAHIGQDEQ